MPEGSLAAQVPISTRVADDTDQANQVATMGATLATDIEDLLERMRTIYASTQSAKELTHAVRARRIQSVGEVAPAAPSAWPPGRRGRRTSATGCGRRQRRGVERPGARRSRTKLRSQGVGHLRRQRPAVLRGLNITLMSYIDRLDFGLTSDPDLLEDPWEIADGIKDARRAHGTRPASASRPRCSTPSSAERSRYRSPPVRA